jgi:4'-phosphopantetheinyl transferase
VDVWPIELGQDDAAVSEASTLLSDEERRRANRGSPTVRRRRILARASLRTVLASYTGSAPEALRFEYGAHGKPILIDTVDGGGASFSLTTSGDCCLIAVTSNTEIGIDVERVMPVDGVDTIAGRYFAPAEAAEIARLTGEPKLLAFYTYWTRGEAYVKARGLSLASRLDRSPMCDDDLRAWTIAALHPGPGLVGALAVRTGNHEASLDLRERSLPKESPDSATKGHLR